MATATRKRESRLSDEDAAKVIALIKDSDSVELKLTIPETEHSSTVAALEIDPLDAQIRQVFFFDTPDLTLYEQGVVVRARRVQKKGDDSVVKLRPVVPSQLPSGVRQLPEFGVEVDAMPGGYVCSGSLKGMPKPDVRETIMGGGRTREALLEGAAGLLRRARSGGTCARRPLGSRADLRPQAQVRPDGLRPQAGRRDVALPRRLSHSRALDQVRPRRGLPGSRRGAGVPHGAGRGSRGCAGDEDPQGARVLLRAAEGHSRESIGRVSSVPRELTQAVARLLRAVVDGRAYGREARLLGRWPGDGSRDATKPRPSIRSGVPVRPRIA